MGKISTWLLIGALFAPIVTATDADKPLTVPALLKAVKTADFSERVDKFSARFHGMPFIDAPLGEGPKAKYDQGPLFRLDGFDCTTFVETVLALALADNPRSFEAWLKRIRYRNGRVGFLERNHFPCGDWVPNNTALGIFTDVTEVAAGPLGTREAKAEESKAGWTAHLPESVIRVPSLDGVERAKRLEQLRKEAEKLPPQTVTVKFIPMEKLLTRSPVPETELARRKVEEEQLTKDQADPETVRKLLHDQRLRYLEAEVTVDERFLQEIPTPAVMNFVRPNYTIPGTRLLISHQGFVIRKKGIPFFRHVTKSGGGVVKDVPLSTYLRLCLLSPAIHGVQVLKINDIRRPQTSEPRR